MTRAVGLIDASARQLNFSRAEVGRANKCSTRCRTG